MTAPPLRPYQVEDRNHLMSHLQKGTHTLYGLPTGGGKTRVASDIIQQFQQEKGGRILITVHRRELLLQMSAALSRLDLDHSLFAAGYDCKPEHPIQLASIDTVRARLSKLNHWLSLFDLVVVDEAHHATAETWEDILQACRRSVRLGLTATPYRLTGKPLGFLFDAAVRGPEISTLVGLGFLAPSWVVSPPPVVNLSAVRTQHGDYVISDLQKLLDRDDIALVAVRAYARWARGEPCIVFCTGVEHSLHVAEAFRAAGWRSSAVYGDMPQHLRDAAIGGLSNHSVQILTSCDLIGEGLDVPEASCGILLRPTKSTGRYKQQVGRLMRPAVGKNRALIVDLIQNSRMHGHPEQTRLWSLRDGLIPGKFTAPVRCPHCWRVSMPEALSCSNCGRPFAPATIMTMTPNDLQNLPLSTLCHMARSLDEFERIGLARGYAHGWAWHRWRELRGTGSVYQPRG